MADFVSIVTRSHYADARVLATTVRRFHPGCRHYIFIVDALSDSDLPPAESNECLIPAVNLLDRNAYMLLCFAYLPVEVCCILKPLALKYVLTQGASTAIYLDCDMSLHGELPGSILPTERFPIALTPHVIGPFGASGIWRFFLHQVGHFNAGFVALSGCAVSRQFCDTWWELSRLHGVGNRHRESTFFDQGWLTMAALQYLEFVMSIDEPAINIAPWNADLRPNVRNPILVHWSGEFLTAVRKGNPPALPDHLVDAFNSFLVDFESCRVAVADYIAPNRFAVFSDLRPVPEGARRWLLHRLRLGDVIEFNPFEDRQRIMREARRHYLRWIFPDLRQRLGWLRREVMSLF